MTRHWRHAIAGLALTLGTLYGTGARAQERAPQETSLNEVTLSASAEQSVVQDWLRMRLVARIEGVDAGAVQAELKQAVQTALAQVQPAASKGTPEDLLVHSDGFALQPRLNTSRETIGWVGQAGVMLEGRDFEAIAQAAANLGALHVERVELTVSSALARTTREEVRLDAITAFRAQALSVAQAFGFPGYDLVDVNVGADSMAGRPPVPLMRAMSADTAPMPVAAGLQAIAVQVSGRIRLR